MAAGDRGGPATAASPSATPPSSAPHSDASPASGLPGTPPPSPAMPAAAPAGSGTAAAATGTAGTLNAATAAADGEEPPPAPLLPQPTPAPEATSAPAQPPGPASTELELFQLEDTSRLQVPVVVTASRQEESANDAPATTIVIGREEIRQRGYSFLKDVLRDMPGMETQEYHFSEYGTLVPVRGVIGNNKIIVLINGTRVNPPGGENMILRSDISVRDAEQIEVVYGPGSTLYGQDAISAVINVITTKSPDNNVPFAPGEARRRLLEPTPAGLRLFNVGMEFGYPSQKEVYGSLNARVHGVRLYGSVHYLNKELTDLSRAYPDIWQYYEAQAAGRGLPLSPTRYDTGLNINLRVEYEGTSLQIWHRQSARNSSEAYGLPPVLGYVNEARWSDMSTVVDARNTARLGTYFSLESILIFNRYEIQPDTRYVFVGTATSPGQPAPWFLDDWKYGRGLSGSLEERLLFRLAQRLTVTAGLFVAHYDVTPKATVPGGADRALSIPSQGGSFTYYTRQGDADSLVVLPRVNPLTYQNFGGYVEANWKIFKPLRLIVGLRLDKNTRVEELAFSPRASLILNLKGFTAKYIFSRAFVAPPPYFAYNVYYNGSSLNTSDPDLLPETAISNELHVSYFSRYVSVGASGYYNLQDNLLLEGDRGSTANLLGTAWLDAVGTQPVTLTHSANGGSSRALGLDLFAKWSAWRLSGWVSYSITHFSSLLEGKESPMQGLSAHNFRLGVTAGILKNLHVTASTLVRSIPENLREVTPTPIAIPVPWEINLHILYAPIPALDIYADFRNLTNNAYYLASLSGSPYPVQTIQATGGLRFSL
ncbi:TonB-dependent receptor [Haliangium sp. UPWRP_2]|uniref:TonB-dependent receptor plug domain-containing protein n=1 Tax=Haliangium sp. UPWRP_2 TaxID=1931276 RepID=UPI0011B270CB|nr:TonB-dependent receptor [Haliangium sp. UPWRP_2]